MPVLCDTCGSDSRVADFRCCGT